MTLWGGVPEEEPQKIIAEPTEEAKESPEEETVTETENTKENTLPVLETQETGKSGQELGKREPEQPKTTLTDEELDEVYAAIERKIQETMEKAGVSFDLFSRSRWM